MQKYTIGTKVEVTTKTPQTRRFKGTRRICNYFYDATSEHVWYGLSLNGKVTDYRSDWLEKI